MKYRLKKDLKKGDIIPVDLGDLTEEVRGGRPEKGQEYWYINHAGLVFASTWEDHGTDKIRWGIGNVFLTREEAEKEIERRKVKQRLKELANFWEPDWGDITENKYYIYYNHDEEKFEIDFYWIYQDLNGVYFETEEQAQSAIDELGNRLNCFI